MEVDSIPENNRSYGSCQEGLSFVLYLYVKSLWINHIIKLLDIYSIFGDINRNLESLK